MRTPALSLLAIVAAAAAARAQDTCASCADTWSGLVGLGIATLPTYQGSDEYRMVPMPVLQLEYKRRFFVGGSSSGVGVGVGTYLVRRPSLTWQVELAGSESRPERRGDALAGMGSRSAASFAGTSVSYRLGAVSAAAGLAVGLGKHEGSYGTVGVTAERPLARRWFGGLAAGATFADRRNMAFDFGVSGAQSAARRALIAAGDPRLRDGDGELYSPGAGLKEMRGSATLGYLLTPRTRAVLFAQGTRLSGEAARSSLVRDRTGAATGLALAYAF